MPSPSKAALFTGLLITAGIFLAGAYAASYLAEPATDSQRDFSDEYYMPSLVPGGNDVRTSASPILARIPYSADTAINETTNKLSQTAKNVSPSMATQPLKHKGSNDAHTQNLSITIEGIRNNQGTVYVLVFDTVATYNNYDYTKAVGYKELPASTQIQTIDFSDLKTGPYAVTMFHDEDGNQDLTLDSSGYPIEGYGTSYAQSAYDKLTFAQASVRANAIKIKMHYLQ